MKENSHTRITIIETPESVQLIILVYKFWIGIVFLFVWVAGAFAMSLMGLGVALIGFFNSIMAGMFGLFWTALVMGAGYIGFAELLWMLKGKEIVTITNDALTVKKKTHDLSKKTKTYLLHSITNLKVERVPNRRMFVWKLQLEDEANFKPDYFCFSFNYQGKNIYFGKYLPKAEATATLQKILGKVVLAQD